MYLMQTGWVDKGYTAVKPKSTQLESTQQTQKNKFNFCTATGENLYTTTIRQGRTLDYVIDSDEN